MGSTVVLGVCGGIAAFRAVDVLRGLVQAGCAVHPILTSNAARFVMPRTFAVLAHREAQVTLWRDGERPGINHIDLARHADLLLVAPATANVVAKLAAGVADDALTTYALAHRRAVVVAPAMNTFMLRHAAIQEALATLRRRGVAIVPPDAGELACGEFGEGRLASVDAIVAAALGALPRRGPLAGIRVLVTAGPTRERIDAVRVLTNRSSGRQGSAIAAAAYRLGAEVTLLAGPGVVVPVAVNVERFESAAQLGALLASWAPRVDVVWHAAAVADFRAASPVEGKLDRRNGALQLALEPVPDLAAAMPRVDGRPYLVIFAAEQAAELETRARRKLADKGADAVVANPIDELGVGMETAANRALVLSRGGTRRNLPAQAKEALARELLLTVMPELLARAAR
jgi:phosphopantothenoylcysteine decarboxylase/phosphopantothenate--cysteine ligase